MTDIRVDRLLAGAKQDHEAVATLWCDCKIVKNRQTAFLNIHDCLQSERGSILLIRHLDAISDTTGQTGSIIATAMVGHDGQTGWVHCLAVTPVWQKNGLGAMLMSLAEDIFVAASIGECRVNAMNENAAAFYRHLGYRLFEPDETDSRPRQDPIYGKRLTR